MIQIVVETWSVENPGLVSPGSCEGRVVLTGSDASEVSGLADKQIFACERPSMALAPLVPVALGFVFASGTPFSHFGRFLREHRLPACIGRDHYRKTAEAAQSGEVCRLDCGSDHLPMGDYPKVRASYRRTLTKLPSMLGHLDLCSHETPSLWGEKATAVNALVCLRVPTPSSLLITQPWLYREPGNVDRIKHAIRQTFPDLDGDQRLILRASLPQSQGSPGSSAIPSLTVECASDFEPALARQLNSCERPQDLVIIAQEFVPSVLRGVLYTGHPWNPVVSDWVFDVRFGNAPASNFFSLHEADNPAALEGLTEDWSAAMQNYPQTRLQGAFVRFIRDVQRLETTIGIPIDVEFVVDRQLCFQVVQFRPLYPTPRVPLEA